MPNIDKADCPEERRTKKARMAPCVYEGWDGLKKKKAEFYPAVNCSYDCDRCGWNPEVKKQRVEKLLQEVAERRKKKMPFIITLCDPCAKQYAEMWRVKPYPGPPTTEKKKMCEACKKRFPADCLKQYVVSGKGSSK